MKKSEMIEIFANALDNLYIDKRINTIAKAEKLLYLLELNGMLPPCYHSEGQLSKTQLNEMADGWESSFEWETE